MVFGVGDSNVVGDESRTVDMTKGAEINALH